MSSTYAHYQTPASLPSDYAILSRYAAAHPELTPDNVEHSDDSDSNTDATIRSHGRRLSVPAAYDRPPNPTMMLSSSSSSLENLPPHTTTTNSSALDTENTPLLGPATDDTVGPDADPHKMYWEELRVLTRYSLPVFGTHLLEYSLVIASVVSIGHLSTTALAAITLGSMTASVSGFSIAAGFASALDTLLPSAWTSPQPQLVGLWAQRMCVVMAGTLVPIFTIWFNAESILLFLKQDAEVARLAALYLRWISLGMPAYAFNGISRRYFQSQGLFMVPTRIIMVVAPINALLNYALVWGPQPIRLGFIGAPIATAISFNLVSILSVIYGVLYTPATAWHPISRRSFTNLGVLVQLGLGGVGQTASEWWAWELVALAASLLGPVTLAAQSVLLVSASTTFQAPFALSVATSVRIGNLLGEKNPTRAGVAAKTSIIMALLIASVWSVMFLTFRHSWGYLFNNDPEVVALVASIMPLVALFQVFDGVSAVTGGIFRARGKQFTSALLNLTSYYIIGVPFGVWLAFRCDLGAHGLWIGLTVSLVYCAVFSTIMSLRTDWDREMRKVMDRVERDNKQVEDEERR